MIDPLRDDTAIAARFNQDILRFEVGAWVKPRPALAFRLSGALLRRDFARASDEDETDLIDAYDPDALIGYRDGLDQIYGELRVVYDDRYQPHPRRTTALPSTGWHVTSWLGVASGLRADPSGHLRYGLDAQRFIHLYGGDRVLVPRLWIEGVTGSLDEIDFVDLPALGGSRILRGYTSGRFRDRLAGAAGLEYRFPIHSLLSGFLFADAGRVFRAASELTLRDVHGGGGGGIIVHSSDRFLLRAQVAVGEDGVLFNASLSPSDRVKRASRRR